MVMIPDWFIRYAAPVGFLALATIAVLLVRPVVPERTFEPRVVREPAPVVRVSPRLTRTRGVRVTAYSVRSGDTLGSVAERFGTTVDRLVMLNPGIDPHALRVGQSLRVE